jgi:hypothetical protein
MLHSQQDLHTAVDSADATATRADAVALVGYLRTDVSDAHVRLYMDPDVDIYMVVAVASIVDRSSVAGDGESGQSMIWVRRDAVLYRHEALGASTFETPEGAQDDTGEISRWPRP